MICRICLTETEFCLPLKNAKNQDKDEETEDVAEVIMKHFDLELDINSDLVCTVCWQQINEFHTFNLFIEEKQNELSKQSPLPAFTGIGNDDTRECSRYRLQICRLCLTGTEFCLPLTNTKNQEKDEKTEDIAEVIMKHFDLELDINSDLVCTVCWQQISEFHTFYSFIEEKQKTDVTPVVTDYEYEMVMENEVTAKAGNGIDIKNESLVDINAPMVAENSLSQWNKEATPKEVSQNVDIKHELIDEVDIEDQNCEPSATPSETVSIYEMDITDEDDDMDMKIESLIEISSRMITENSLCQWNQEASPQKVTENFDTKNNELIDQVDLEPARCETNANDTAETARTQQNKITPTQGKQQDLEKITLPILKCDLCAQTVETFYNLKLHFKKEHHRRAYVMCCKRRYCHRSTYVKHMEWHSNPNLWKCKPCNQVFSSRHKSEEHSFIVHPKPGSITYQCKFCPIKFSKEYLLHKHVRGKHSKENYKCDECNKEFKNLIRLESHKKRFHLRANDTKCDICGKNSANRSSLKIHKAGIHGVEEFLNFQCPSCPKKFAFKNLLTLHTEERHSKQKIKCDECNKEYPSLRTLNHHKRNSHLRAYATECDICGLICVNSTAYKAHKANVHGAEEYLIFQCPCCPKKFAFQGLLNKHRNMSHNEQKSKCDECGKEFKNLYNLKQHRRKFHKTSTKPKTQKADINQVAEHLNLQCSNCTRKFVTEDLLNKHRSSCHNE